MDPDPESSGHPTPDWTQRLLNHYAWDADADADADAVRDALARYVVANVGDPGRGAGGR